MKISLAAAAGVLSVMAPQVTAAPAAASTEPMWIAHRGGMNVCVENTLAGFACGFEHGAGRVELDVWTLADGKLAVHHDKRLDRATNCTGPVQDVNTPTFLACMVDVWPDNPQPTTLFRPVVRQFGDPLAIEPKTRQTASKVMDRLDTEGAEAIIFTGNWATATDAVQRGFDVIFKKAHGHTPEELASMGAYGLRVGSGVSENRLRRLHDAGLAVWVTVRSQKALDAIPGTFEAYLSNQPYQAGGAA